MTAYDESDTGLPENPIYSNYSNHLWKSHAGRRARLNVSRLQQETAAKPTPQVDLSPAIIRLAPVAAENVPEKMAA